MLRRLVLALSVLVLAAMLAEGFARVVYWAVEHRALDLAAVNARKRQLLDEAHALEVRPDRKAQGTYLALHPYLGFVYDPGYDPEGMRRQHGLPVSPFGFVDDKWPVLGASKDDVIVGIFGGSMAWWVSKEGAEALAEELSPIPELRDKRIVIVRAALGGYKQPQQLMALTYLLSLGAHFDIIVNLDGFNEVAITPEANVARDVFPFYPRDWSVLVGELDDPMVTRLAGEITALTRLRGYWAEAFLLPILRSTAITTLLWRSVDGALGQVTAERRLDLAAYEGQLDPEQRRFASHGPHLKYRDDDEVYADVARVWQESSLQMHRLARANKARYYHFLQPNQYVQGAKPMLDDERKVALREDSDYGKSVVRGYPRLREAGQQLDRQGVRFEDLTGLFGGIGKPLYIDDCCHVSADGNAMIGRHIGETIAADFTQARRERERREQAQQAAQLSGGVPPRAAAGASSPAAAGLLPASRATRAPAPSGAPHEAAPAGAGAANGGHAAGGAPTGGRPASPTGAAAGGTAAGPATGAYTPAAD
ncbi:MAG TPA: hypothetical protein VFD92_19865 [Candidatus Binatia bacterium]|nr:hypothetical protein [Candidatus Binatia bacterium]